MIAPIREILPLGVVFLGAAIIQWMLGELKFSTLKAEWVFRSLFLVPFAFNFMAIFTLRANNHRERSTVRTWLRALPAILIVVLFWLARHDSDAQGALFIIFLPMIHGIAIILFCLLTRPQSHRR